MEPAILLYGVNKHDSRGRGRMVEELGWRSYIGIHLLFNVTSSNAVYVMRKKLNWSSSFSTFSLSITSNKRTHHGLWFSAETARFKKIVFFYNLWFLCIDWLIDCIDHAPVLRPLLRTLIAPVLISRPIVVADCGVGSTEGYTANMIRR